MKKSTRKCILGFLCIGFVVICLSLQFVLNQDTKRLKKEGEKLENLVVKTKSGMDIETTYRNINEEKFYIKIPTDFQILNEELLYKKYSGEVPTLVFSNEETTINVAVSLSKNTMKDAQIKEYKEYMEKLLKENSEIVDTRLYEVDGHSVGQIKLITEASDTNIYNNMIFFSYKDKLVIINFNCTIDLKEEWQDVGDFIIDSLFFKE